MIDKREFKKGWGISHDRIYSRTAHVFIRLAEFGIIMASRAALLDDIFDNFLQTAVVIFVTRNPWWFPDMKTTRVAKDMVRQIFVGF